MRLDMYSDTSVLGEGGSEMLSVFNIRCSYPSQGTLRNINKGQMSECFEYLVVIGLRWTMPQL